MASVIRTWNSANEATLLSGHHVYRQQALFLKSHERAYPCLPTELHFCYKEPVVRQGSTIMCTCGATGAVFGREGYRRWTSVNYGNEVIACSHFIQYGKHADGSHE